MRPILQHIVPTLVVLASPLVWAYQGINAVNLDGGESSFLCYVPTAGLNGG